MTNLTPNERAAIEAFHSFLTKELGSRIRDIRVFGSRACGEGHEDSDIDILVLVNEVSGNIRHSANFYTDFPNSMLLTFPSRPIEAASQTKGGGCAIFPDIDSHIA